MNKTMMIKWVFSAICVVILSGCVPTEVCETSCQLVATKVGGPEPCAECESKPVRSYSKKQAPQPVDLANVLAMGGANNLQIEMARKRVLEAHIDYQDAKSNWLPSLRFGVGYNKHHNQIQSTTGQVVNADRNSLFVGGGAGLGNASLAGGSGGPSRLAMNMSLADAFFKPIIARRGVQSNSAAECAMINDSLLNIALGYFDLIESHGLLANASVGLNSSKKMLATSTAFEQQGLESPAEVQRAKTDYAMWQQKVMDAERRTVVASAELTRQLRLDPTSCLCPADEKVVPIYVIDTSLSRDELIKQGLANRPELTEQDALIAASKDQLHREKYELLLPHVQAGMSGGNFGGGSSNRYANSSGRSDLDLMAVWELKNLGRSHANAKNRRGVQLEQSLLKSEWIADKIAAEIITAKCDIDSYGSQIKVARSSVNSAAESYESNVVRIAQDEGQPIELLQAIQARSEALDLYTRAVSNHNRAQFRLLRAIGRPPSVCE